MNITDLLTIAAIVGAVNVVLGNWAKSRIEHSIKHEYDQALEKIKSEWKRADILLASAQPVLEIVTCKTDCYQSISVEIDKCIHALFKDLGFEH